MKMRFLFPVSFILTVLVWMILSWPLPLHVTSAITVSAHGGDDQQIQYMIPGDSLQLLYFFELVKEWFQGTTPWFYNLYEFNTGDDAPLYSPGGYYAPFSYFYALGAAMVNQAFGMNITGVISLWLTMLFTWLLLRRYCRDEWIVALFSVFVLIFPYRWKNLFDASPTGFVMMWVPLFILGLDIAVRDGKLRGGLIAGAALIMLYVGDIHVFFFSALIAPAWCFLALFAKSTMTGNITSRLVAIAQALSPVILAALIVGVGVASLSSHLEDSQIAEGRSIREVAYFSPTIHGFLFWQDANISSQVHVGWTMPCLILIASLLMFRSFWQSPGEKFQPMLFWVMLILGAILIAILALGPHGPLHGGLYILAREIIPPYAMLRQAGKIFCLMPTILAVAGVLALVALVHFGPARRWWRVSCILLVAVLLFFEYPKLSNPRLTLLQNQQTAYAAVAEDAEGVPGEDARALILTLWPGDSHFASLYQYYAIRYRIRIINGYSPIFSQSYFDDVFLRFYSINQGYLSNEQIENLLSRGIRYLILHEDLYPEKVAPFPISYSIKTYLEHPRLRFLRQDGSVWAFRILESSEEHAPGDIQTLDDWTSFFPARHMEMEKSILENAEVLHDPQASGGAYVSLNNGLSSVTLSLTGSPPAPELRWMVRARGKGRIQARVHTKEDATVSQQEVFIDHEDWSWIDVFAPIDTYTEISLSMQQVEGAVEVDSALLTAGRWPFLQPGQSISLPAPIFFHAGYTDLEYGRLVFRKEHEAQRIIFYGPKLPLEPGRYDVSMAFTTAAEAGMTLGVLHFDLDWNTKEGPGIDVMAGHPFQASFTVRNNLPLNMSFIYLGRADMTIDHVVFTRVE
ncbi:MAG TPA: hypothetical protein ENN39_05830 [Desulfonatronum sp.]|nr:hypothetical protein [Desulfonatronum sp.]